MKVERAYACEDYYVITCKDMFEVYRDKLDKVFQAELPEHIACVEFDKQVKHLFIGTTQGKLYKYGIESQQVSDVYVVDE